MKILFLKQNFLAKNVATTNHKVTMVTQLNIFNAHATQFVALHAPEILHVHEKSHRLALA